MLKTLPLLLALAVPSHADSLFDGGAGAPTSLPPFKFTPRPPAQAAAPAEPQTQQSGSDLYFFSAEDAQKAAKLAEQEGFSALSGDYTFDRDVPPDIQQQTRADLAFMAGIRGDGATPLHQQVFGAVDGGVYDQFFRSRVSAIGMSGCGNGNAVACVIPLMGPHHMWLTKNYIKFSHPQVSRMMVVYHEARHTEIGHLFWGHKTCPTPFKDADGNDMKSIWTGASLAGEPACDGTAFGSYGSSTILLKNIQLHCTNCTDKVRMDAGLYADDQLGRIIDAGSRRQMLADFKR